MTNFVDFFQAQINKWNDEQLCGYCWEFEAPLRLSDLNESVQKTDDCCVRVFMTDWSFNIIREYAPNNYVKDYKVRQNRFSLYFLLNDRIDINVYKEQDGHPLSESKWETILKPILECLQEFDFCELYGQPAQYVSEMWRPTLDYADQNYSGWRIDYTINEVLYQKYENA